MEALGGPLCRGNVAAWPSIAVAALTLSSCSSMCGSTTFDEPDPDPDAERFISRAVFAAGRLWLLTDTGGLSSIAPGSLRRVDAGL
ncbi:MAG TPA: hypothetical protein VMG12_09385, partial [Polyangiaceae bacterium]|nr:hypothetical protein [Polyangiaceae bacterium]